MGESEDNREDNGENSSEEDFPDPLADDVFTLYISRIPNDTISYKYSNTTNQLTLGEKGKFFSNCVRTCPLTGEMNDVSNYLYLVGVCFYQLYGKLKPIGTALVEENIEVYFFHTNEEEKMEIVDLLLY